MKVLLSALLASAADLSPMTAMAQDYNVPIDINYPPDSTCATMTFNGLTEDEATPYLYSVRTTPGNVLIIRDDANRTSISGVTVTTKKGLEVYKARWQTTYVLIPSVPTTYIIKLSYTDNANKSYRPSLTICLKDERDFFVSMDDTLKLPPKLIDTVDLDKAHATDDCDPSYSW